jgi:hypothetical protein
MAEVKLEEKEEENEEDTVLRLRGVDGTVGVGPPKGETCTKFRQPRQTEGGGRRKGKKRAIVLSLHGFDGTTGGGDGGIGPRRDLRGKKISKFIHFVGRREIRRTRYKNDEDNDK